MWTSIGKSKLWGNELWGISYWKECEKVDAQRWKASFSLWGNVTVEALMWLCAQIPMRFQLWILAARIYCHIMSMGDLSLEKQAMKLMWECYTMGDNHCKRNSWVFKFIECLIVCKIIRDHRDPKVEMLRGYPPKQLKELIEVIVDNINFAGRVYLRGNIVVHHKLGLLRNMFPVCHISMDRAVFI